MQQLLPVLTSIGIIIGVAILREHSKLAAAILASAPMNVPLALWVTFGSEIENPAVINGFMRSVMWGLGASTIWILVVWFCISQGMRLLPAIGLGYLAWGMLIGLMWWFGILRIGS
jgi:hypothetical protein